MNKVDIFYERISFWTPKIVIVSLMALILAGCSVPNNNSATPSPNNAPIAGNKLDVSISQVDMPVDIESKQNVVVETGNRILVITAGSGSCPPLVENVYVDGNNVKLFTKQYLDQPCTMDYRMYPQIITHKNDSNVFQNKTFFLCQSENDCFMIPSRNSWDPTPV